MTWGANFIPDDPAVPNSSRESPLPFGAVLAFFARFRNNLRRRCRHRGFSVLRRCAWDARRTVEAGRRQGIEVIADRHPEWRILYQTDNYGFARVGVPTIHFFTGLHTDYHQPSDTADKIRYTQMARITAVSVEMVRAYLDGAPRPPFERPKWFVTP